MAKMVSRKRKPKKHTVTDTPPPRWRLLPPDVIYIIVELFKDDKATLRACSLATREFTCPALSYIGRHITVNRISCIKKCVQLLTSRSAFQHIRSLDLGVTSKTSNPGVYLEEQITILEIFAQRQMLTCLWLSNFSFPSVESGKRGKIRDIVTALASTVDNLGLYGCRFPSYTDMISFIRTFPRCDSLFVRSCVTDGPNSTENMFSGLPEHKLSLRVLELTSATSNGLNIIDVSTLIEDAVLDVSQLSTLTCSVASAEQARCVATATSGSPIFHAQLACMEPGGFQAFLDSIAKKWTLESLTIGPMFHTTNRTFWEHALHNFPVVPRLEEFTFIFHYPPTNVFNSNCWDYFAWMIRREDIFPHLMRVDLRITIGSSPLNYEHELQQILHWAFGSICRLKSVTLWGSRE